MMSPQDRINEQLAETSSIKETAKKQLTKLGVPEYVRNLQMASFDKRLDNLKIEKDQIESVLNKEEIVVTLHSPDLPSGQISVRSLTIILGGLQNLSDSIANTLYNQPSEKGKIPQEILEQNEFILRETKAGSFKAVLELKHPEQSTFEEPVQTQTVSELFGLLESSNTPDNLAETISLLGPRALRNYSEWTKALKELNTSVDIEWLSSYRSPSIISFDSQKADRIFSILSDFSDAIEEEVIIEGKLTGANVRTKNFEIITENGEKITGRISKDALGKIANFGLNNDCLAILLKVKVIGPANREKVSWTLRDIKRMEADDK